LQTQALLGSQSYAASYYNQYVAYVRQEAEAALRVVEQHAAQVLIRAETGGESTPVRETNSTITAVEQTPTDTQSVAVATPIAAGRNDGETLIPLHHHQAQVDWTAQLVAEDGRGTEAPGLTGDERVTRLAVAGVEPREDLIESGDPVAGIHPMGIAALENEIDQFFEYLGARAEDLASLPNLATLGSWLAASLAATAAFELARSAARPMKTAGFANMGWHEISLGLFPNHDES
jgi:hypothetical protein